MCRFEKLPDKLEELILSKLQRTSLFSLHRELNAKTIAFAGYEMPVNYPLGILNEHIHCRKLVGLFDVSHMGQIRISSKSISMHDLARELEKLIPIDLVSLSKDRQRYGFLTNEKGGVIDDLMISNRGGHFFVVVNASRKKVDTSYFRENLISEVDILVETERSLIALQGPLSEQALSSIIPGVESMKFMDARNFSFNNEDIYISRSGYTGQDGFEVSLPNHISESFCRSLLNIEEVEAIGLGARDTLRLEKGYLLSGVDFIWPQLESSEPFLARDTWETNVPFGLDLEHDFVGKNRVISHHEDDARWWGIRYLEKGPLPRPGKEVHDLQGNSIGKLSSGAPAPSLENTGIGIGYISGVQEGDEVLIVASPRKSVRAVIVRPPFI